MVWESWDYVSTNSHGVSIAVRFPLYQQANNQPSKHNVPIFRLLHRLLRMCIYHFALFHFWQTLCPLYTGEPPCGQLNPKNNHTYTVLEKLYGELMEATRTTDVFHLGGDEVNLECWSQYFNDTDLRSLWCDFMLQAYQKLRKANKNAVPKFVVVWSSGLTSSQCLSRNNFAVQVWGVCVCGLFSVHFLCTRDQCWKLDFEPYNIDFNWLFCDFACRWQCMARELWLNYERF